MISKKKLYKSCLVLGVSVAASSIVSLPFASNKHSTINNNIVQSHHNNSLKTTTITGTIETIDQYDHVEVNLSNYDIDLNKYNVNVDQTSETGIPLQNGFQIRFEMVSKNKFKIFRTSVRKYYRLYILDKNSENSKNDKQYFEKIIKVDNFGSNGTNSPKIESSIQVINPNDSNSITKFKSFFIDKGVFKKESGFDKQYLESMKNWDMGKVYDEMNGFIFNVSNKNTFINEAKEIGYNIEKDEKNDIEKLHFWIILKDEYVFKINNENEILIYSDFQIERDSPPPSPPIIDGGIDGGNGSINKNSSTTQTTIFTITAISVLLFIIAIILFITISNKNKVKQKRNYDLEKAIKNRRKI